MINENFVALRRARRKLTPAKQLKATRITVGSLVKAWHVEKMVLEKFIIDIAQERGLLSIEGEASNEQQA